MFDGKKKIGRSIKQRALRNSKSLPGNIRPRNNSFQRQKGLLNYFTRKIRKPLWAFCLSLFNLKGVTKHKHIPITAWSGGTRAAGCPTPTPRWTPRCSGVTWPQSVLGSAQLGQAPVVDYLGASPRFAQISFNRFRALPRSLIGLPWGC